MPIGRREIILGAVIFLREFHFVSESSLKGVWDHQDVPLAGQGLGPLETNQLCIVVYR